MSTNPHQDDDDDEVVLIGGLANIGNTCYLNSAMQCIANQGDFVAALWRMYNVRDPLRISSKHNKELLCAVSNVFDEMHRGTNVIQPVEVLRSAAAINPTFESMQQADAPELLLTVLSAIDDELWNRCHVDVMDRLSFEGTGTPMPRHLVQLKDVYEENIKRDRIAARRKGKPEPLVRPLMVDRSIVADFFQGLVLSSWRCPNCQETSRAMEPFLSLELHLPNTIVDVNKQASQQSGWGGTIMNIVRKPFSAVGSWLYGDDDDISPLTLEQCFDSHCAEEHFTKGNTCSCDYCGDTVHPRRSIQFAHLPEVLVVHLKRFRHGYWSSKIKRYVECPENLDLSRYVSDPATVACQYELNAVINHHGEMGHGHYTAFAHKKGAGWGLFNDATLSRATVDDAINSEVYVAVYRKKKPSAATSPEVARIAKRLMKARAPRTAAPADGESTSKGLVISKQWVCRLSHVADPGPILNAPCYCDRDSVHTHGPLEERYVSCSEEEWAVLTQTYGGGPKITLSEWRGLVQQQRNPQAGAVVGSSDDALE
eukprot:PhM_4_TR9057/c0_g1_i1/m.47746/K11848/USP20_33; ubiquitin carboxyl-terminal hydrolase 20/33